MLIKTFHMECQQAKSVQYTNQKNFMRLLLRINYPTLKSVQTCLASQREFGTSPPPLSIWRGESAPSPFGDCEAYPKRSEW